MEFKRRASAALGRILRWNGLPLLLLLAFGATFLYELISVQGVPFVRDVQVFFLPQARILSEALQQGRLPLWTPLLSTGLPFLANFQSGVFYPPHWLYAGVPFLTGFNWLIALHVILAGIGAYYLCRQLGHSRVASWIGGVTFMLGGYLVSLTNLVNVLQTAAWAPLMLATLIRHLRRPRPATFAALVAVHLFAFLAGAPYTFVLAAALSTGFGLLWTYVRARGNGGQASWKTVALTIAGAAVAVAALAAVQLLPTLRMVAESTRSTGLAFGEAATYSLDPVRLLHLVFPNEFSDPTYRYGHKLQLVENPPWLLSVYLGIVATILAVFAAEDRDRRAEVVFWAVAAGLGLVLTLGAHTPVFGLARKYVPGMSAFRYPEKFFFLTGFSFSVLTAHGFSALRDRTSGRDWPMKLAAALAAILVGVDVLWTFQGGVAQKLVQTLFAGGPVARHVEFAYQIWSGTLTELSVLVAASVVLIFLYRRGRVGETVFASLIVLLVSADFWLAHRHLVPLVEPRFYRQPVRVSRVLPMDELRLRHRYRASPFNEHAGEHYSIANLPRATQKWIIQNTLQPNIGVLYDILTVDSRDAIHLRRSELQEQAFGELPESWRWRLLELNSVKYLYSPEDFSEEHYASRVRLDSIPGAVYELKSPLPRAYVARGRFYSDDDAVLTAALDPARRGEKPVALLGDSAGSAPAALRQWAAGRSDFDLAASTDADTTTDAEARAEIVRDAGEKVRIRIDPSDAGFLVLTDSYYPGWRVYVDGERRPLLRANYFFRAVPVDRGDREVVFRYTSEPFQTGRWISGGSLVLLVGGLAGWRRTQAGSGGPRQNSS